MTVSNFAVALGYLYATEKRFQMVQEKVFYLYLHCIVPGS